MPRSPPSSGQFETDILPTTTSGRMNSSKTNSAVGVAYSQPAAPRLRRRGWRAVGVRRAGAAMVMVESLDQVRMAEEGGRGEPGTDPRAGRLLTTERAPR